MEMPTLGSLFDGSGGFPLAGQLSGITPIWAAEVEPYPIAVTRSRFPQMMHLGSVTGVHGDKVKPVDVITFGSPCQDLSVAGKRAGIHDGQRSNLFFEAIRIIREMREATNGVYPTFAIWENAPGAFSSNKGEDFRCVLEEFVRISAEISVPRPASGRWSQSGEIVGDGYSVAWRQLDAQYWGVPQRRKRIYLVADFAGERAGEILFERESLRGHPAARGATGQGAATDAARSAGGSRDIGCLNPWDAQTIRQYAIDGVFPALGTNSGGGQNRAGVCFAQNQRDELRDLGEKTGALAAERGMHQQNFIALKCMNPWDCQSKRIYQPDGVYPTLPAMDNGGANSQAVLYAFDSMTSNSMKSSSPHSGFHEETVAKTLQACGVDPTCNQGGNVIVEPMYTMQGNGIDRPVICFKSGQGAKSRSLGESETVTPTLGSEAGGNSVPAVCYDARGNGNGTCCPTLTGDHENRVTDYTTICCEEVYPKVTGSLCANTHPGGVTGQDAFNDMLPVTPGKPPRKYIIRRLTPLECCRLQGFPDGWGIPDHKDKLSDEELAFWQQVRDTCAAISGKPPKKYSAEALTKWYNSLHTDSAEYKMWGNGIALPCAAFVLAGIAEKLEEG